MDPATLKTPERILNYAAIIRNENLRLKQQVERVLQMARFDKDDLTLKKEAASPDELVQEAVRNNSLAIESRQATVRLELNAHDVTFMVDKLHFTNLIYNLLDNALKYNNHLPVVVVRTRVASGQLLVSVTDNGIGISPEEQRRIFHRFYRVPTGNLHDVKGFGLGLSYVKQIVEKHRGRISVESEQGKGSTFTMLFPLA